MQSAKQTRGHAAVRNKASISTEEASKACDVISEFRYHYLQSCSPRGHDNIFLDSLKSGRLISLICTFNSFSAPTAALFFFFFYQLSFWLPHPSYTIWSHHMEAQGVQKLFSRARADVEEDVYPLVSSCARWVYTCSKSPPPPRTGATRRFHTNKSAAYALRDAPSQVRAYVSAQSINVSARGGDVVSLMYYSAAPSGWL